MSFADLYISSQLERWGDLATKWPQQILTTSAPLEAFNDIERPPWMCWHAFVVAKICQGSTIFLAKAAP